MLNDLQGQPTLVGSGGHADRTVGHRAKNCLRLLGGDDVHNSVNFGVPALGGPDDHRLKAGRRTRQLGGPTLPVEVMHYTTPSGRSSVKGPPKKISEGR